MTSTPIHLKFFVTAKKLALVAVLQVMLEFWCQNIGGADLGLVRRVQLQQKMLI